MRLPPISRSHITVLTRGRWAFAPSWQALSRRHDYRSSQAVAVAQQSPPSRTSTVVDSCSPSQQPFKIRRQLSPNRVTLNTHSLRAKRLLAIALSLYRSPSQTISERRLADALFLTRLNGPQLSLITAHYILRQTPQLDVRIASLLHTDSEWKAILEHLAAKGYTPEDLSKWAWILAPADMNERVDRFLSTPGHKPLFILFYILRTVPIFSSPEVFSKLLDYCKKWYSGRQKQNVRTRHHWFDQVVTPTTFIRMQKRLAAHAIKVRPDALSEIANLSVAYIEDIAHSRELPEQRYKLQCSVFNCTLQAVSAPTKLRAYINASHNWNAVTTLLSMSSILERPLVIERESYRAIRQILLALPKTDSERDTASALTASWPPYRVLRDGMEEKADTENYLSRVVKAGIMMQGSGYSKEEIDLTTDILGGMAPDGSPTIQTRANYPRQLRIDQGTWAALIRATRNPQEAWAVFRNPPEPGMKPKFQVYRELITKLSAKKADPNHNNLPGDGREVHPHCERGLSEFEKARILPPGIRKVTEDMFRSGVTIGPKELAWLIRQSPSVERALDYIDHSTLDKEAKKAFRSGLEVQEDLPWDVLARTHHDIIYACIDLYCRIQPNRTQIPPKAIPIRSLGGINYALRFARAAWMATPTRGLAPYELILSTLARPNIMVSPEAPIDNSVQVLILATTALQTAEPNCGLTLDMLQSYGRIIFKTVLPRLSILIRAHSPMACSEAAPPRIEAFMSLYHVDTTIPQSPRLPVFNMPGLSNTDDRSWSQMLTPIFQNRPSGKPRLEIDVVRDAVSKLKSAWRALSSRGPARRPEINPLVRVCHINTYMRALAFTGEYEEMVLLLWWVVREWAPKAGQNLSLADTERLARVVRGFRAFAEPMLDEDVVAPLRKEIVSRDVEGRQCSIYWPADEEVEHYIHSDVWFNHQNLNNVLNLAVSKQQDLESLEDGTPTKLEL